MMGPGREPKECENDELVLEFEAACRAGDREFADEYKKEIVSRLEEKSKRSVCENKTVLHQKVVGLRSELIIKRIEHDKQLQIIKLLDNRERNLTETLKEIIDILNNYNQCVTRGRILNIANKAIHSD